MAYKVRMVDYIGTCDEYKKPIGHQIKIINEYLNLIGDDIEINLAIPKIYKEMVDLKKSKKNIWLNSEIITFDSNFKVKIKNFYQKISSINSAITMCENDELLWFVNFDYFLGIYLLFNRKKINSKFIITTFMESYTSGNFIVKYIKNKLYNKVLKQCNQIMTSNNNVVKKYSKALFLPDYYYSDQYKNFKKDNKINEVLCVGTMNEMKDLELLVETFSNLDINLSVIGRFSDKIRYQNLKEKTKKMSNVTIKDKNLDYNEYYELISKYKYIILPYKKQGYKDRTSGVLLETIFLESIPIAPKYLLEFNGINGVGYDDMNELKNYDFGNFVQVNNEVSKFNKDVIKKQLINILVNCKLDI